MREWFDRVWAHFRDWMRQKPLEVSITCCVALLHLSLLVYLAGQPLTLRQASPTPAVKVRQVRLAPPPPAPKPVVKASPPTPKPKPKPVSKPKPKPKPKPVAKKPAPRQSPPQRSERRVQEDAEAARLLEAVQRSLSQVSESETPRTEPESPQVRTLDTSTRVASAVRETDYVKDLVSQLRNQLRLPDYGDVEVRLTVARDGAVQAVEILSAQSSLNREYVSNRLPSLKLTPFGSRFGSEQRQSFTLTLSNE